MKKFLLKKLNFKFSKLLTAILLILIVLLSISIAYAFDVFVGGSENVAVGKGLIGHWTLDGEDYNSATNRVTDRTPYSNHGTNYGATLTTDRFGKSGGAMGFDGSSNYINAGNDASLRITGSQTISMWLKPANIAEGRQNPYNKAYGGEGTITQETNGALNYYWGTGGGDTTPYQGYTMTNVLQDGEWVHVVIVRDLDAMKLRWYKNGNLTNQGDASYEAAVASSNSVSIGSGYAGAYSGSIDDVRIYNRILSEDEIKLLYESYNPAMETASTEGGLIGHWKMDEAGFVEYTENTLGQLTNASSKWGELNLTSTYFTAPNGHQGVFLNITNYTSGGVNWYNTGGQRDALPSTQYTVSAIIKFEGSGNPSANLFYLRQYWSNGTQITEGGQFSSSFMVPLSGGWYKAYRTFTTHPECARFVIQGYEYKVYRTWIYDVQVEQRNYFTPYVDGIRQSKLTDITPYSNHGTINGTNLTTDRLGKEKSAVIFDGVSDHVNLALKQSGSTNPYSISMWIKVSQSHNDPSLLLYAGAGSGRLWIRQDPTYIVLNSYFGSGYDYWGSSVTTPKEEWFHIVAVFNRTGNQSLYMNGVLRTTLDMSPASSIPWSTGTFYLGNELPTFYKFFNGSIDDVLIYNRALSADEIKLLYESYQPQTTVGSANAGLILDMPLTSKWTKSETPGSERMTDRTPYSNDGQNYGATITSGGAEFDGSSDYISLSYAPQYNIREAITFSTWIKRTTDFNQLTDVMILGRNPSWFFYDAYNSGSVRGDVYIDEVRQGALTAPVPYDGNWYHIVYTYDSSTRFARIYRNGDLYSSSQLTGLNNYLIDSSTANFRNIGSNSLGRGLILNGLKIYNRALSADEVKLLFDRGRA